MSQIVTTLLTFMTDSGTTAGWITFRSKEPYFNSGMRGWKSSAYDGGHRVPLFWHWPQGKLAHGKEVPKLSAHIDILPTLVDLLGLRQPVGLPLDGMPLAPLLRDPATPMHDRTLFTHVQRQYLPPKWTNSAVMTERWRLVHGEELFESQTLEESATQATFRLQVPADPTTLKTWLTRPGPERAEQGAYYVQVEWIED